MLNRLHFKQTESCKVFLTSDLHAKHAKDFILEPRGYKTADEAYSHIFKSWNETVRPTDVVFNLGDFVVGAGTNSLEVTKELIHGLNGKIYTLFGNHTAGVKQLYRETIDNQYGKTDHSVEIYPVNYQDKFIFLGDYVEIVVDGKLCILNHYPLGSWNEMRGSIHCFGHCHSNYPINPNLRYMDVGWDYKKRPLSFDEIYKELQKIQFKPIDHHGKE